MDLFEEVIKLRRSGKRGALATIVHTNGSIPSFESSRMLVREDGSIAGTIGGGCVEAEVWAAAKEVMDAEAPRKMTFSLNNEANYDNGLICGGTLEIFVEPILPQPILYIFGGGHVSIALANAANTAGFAIGVIDDRESFANRERFPMANEIYTSFEEAFEKIKPTAATYMVIVTRGHKDDMHVLRWAVGTAPRYIGMIGSKRKVISVYNALEKEGIPPGKIRQRARTRGACHRRADAGRDCHQHHGGTDRRAPRRAKHPEQIRKNRNRGAGPGSRRTLTKILLERTPLLVAVILSAGASSRMGRPKALLPYREGTFLEHLIEVTRHPRIAITRVVLGAGAETIRTAAKLDPSVVVLNPDWEQGQLSSICAGTAQPGRNRERWNYSLPRGSSTGKRTAGQRTGGTFLPGKEIDCRSHLQESARPSGDFFKRAL